MDRLPSKRRFFYKWLNQLEADIQSFTNQRGLHNISEAMKKSFGEQTVTKTFSVLGERSFNLRENGNLKMNTGTGVLGTIGKVTTLSHNFHGRD